MSKNIIGIVAAMESEIELIKEAVKLDSKKTMAQMEFCIGSIFDKNVVVVQCGIGKVNASIATQLLINEFNASYIINVGCAGNLNNLIGIGDFVVSNKVAQHDYDASAVGFKPGEIPYTNKVFFEADEKLISLASDSIKNVAAYRKLIVGQVVSGDQFIEQKSQKDLIMKNYPDADCVEMEGGSVGQTCYLNNIPFVVIRAMSDNSDSSSDFAKYQEKVVKEGAKVVIDMVKNMSL
ncbi:adenosylhomocysteine nucleosidase [Acetitomaculum ruminis DSM 5522]|uniref:adenosylhomocysteine nucleosidase n=1 Tax=Acetitomaculum ruminis DSM 5522 TaxID=1120918 RepID=A0A1I0WL29_9FIRM|nr:5'-methylthioadenosine/adenosylhomocysteine nucleosidase [Acetitomaculum ruminis]SFA89077.1 adenosylhomocysteine nucleosidase [Acetitomaculum ruminis DSM 5522]